jgi:hypothetical protein
MTRNTAIMIGLLALLGFALFGLAGCSNQQLTTFAQTANNDYQPINSQYDGYVAADPTLSVTDKASRKLNADALGTLLQTQASGGSTTLPSTQP